MTDLKLKIKEKSRLLFCKNGVVNITLRDVAKELGKSYGNITYHYPSKKIVLEKLLEDFHAKLDLIKKDFNSTNDHFSSYKSWPADVFKVLDRYSFFISDHLELQRSFPEFTVKFDIDNSLFKSLKMDKLHILKQEGYLIKNMSEDKMLHLVNLEKASTIFYFQNHSVRHRKIEDYKKSINWILYPHLTDKGKLKYIRS